MGYETTLIVVEAGYRKRDGSPKGYMSILGTIDLSKVAVDSLGELITKSKAKNDYKDEIAAYEEAYKQVYNSEGDYNESLSNYTEEQKKKLSAKVHRKEKAVNLPYIFYNNGNKQDYTDDCGDTLMIADVKDVYSAIMKDQAKSIENGEYEHGKGYRRFTVALKMLEAFMDKEQWGNDLKVVLWGH